MLNSISQQNVNVNDSGLKVAFLGTPEFAVPILEKLASSEHKPAAVFCAPDKPVGRRQVMTPPPVKTLAQKYNIPICQPENVSSFKFQVSSLNPDLIICAAYRIIFPKEILDMPKFGCLNIHPSLLPKYRGASPIQAAILNGDTKTGVTIFKMDEQIDHGPILIAEHLSLITKRYTSPELSDKLSILGAGLLIKILPDWVVGKITPIPQDNSQATYAPQIKKEDGQIDWQKSAQETERQIRAYSPWPGASTGIMNFTPSKVEGNESGIKGLRIIKADAKKDDSNRQLGEIFLDKNNELSVQAGQGYLIIKKLQLEGGKPLSAQDFLRGHKKIIGQILT